MDGSSETKIGHPVRHAGKLYSDHPRREKGGEDIPAGADAAEPREANARSTEALGDIPGYVDPNHVKRYPLRPGPSQRRQSMTNLFEANPEAAADDVDVVALLAGSLEKWGVRHQHRTGEVIRQCHPSERPGLGGSQVGIRNQSLENGALRKQSNLMGELELPTARRKKLGQGEQIGIRVEPPERSALRPPMGGPHLNAVLLFKVSNQLGVKLLGVQSRIAPDSLGARFEAGEMIHVPLDQVANLLRRQVRKVGPRQLVIVGDARREVFHRLARGLERAIEPQNRAGGARAGGGHLANLGGSQRVRFEQGVRECLEQVGYQSRVVVAGEGVQINLEYLRQL